MKFFLQNGPLKSFLSTLSLCSHHQLVAADSNIRGNASQSVKFSHRVLETDTAGTFLIADIQYEAGSIGNVVNRNLRDLGNQPEQTFNVELPDGTIFELDNLPTGFEVSKMVSGRTSISLPAGTQLLPNGKADMKGKAPHVLANIFERRGLNAFAETTEEQELNRAGLRRQLAVKEGSKTVLAVRVIASDGFTTPDETFVSNSVFGNGMDSVNLASQYDACSHGKLNFIKAEDRVGSTANISNGVVTVNLPTVSVTEGDSVMRNAISTELYNIFGVSASNLANHVMYCLPPNTMSGIAYAYINSWNSVYSDYWCTYVSGQMHEIGHNLNFAHSNELGTYKDQTGMMGYSYGQSDTNMCFNGAKSWQSGWYADKEVTVNSAAVSGTSSCFDGNMFGIVDYPTATTVLLKVQDDVNSVDYYVNFNAKKGINSGTREGGNQVTITSKTQAVRDTYSESELVAKLGGQTSLVFANYNITVGEIDIAIGKAHVTVLPSGQSTCLPPSPAPSNVPTTGFPTKSPSPPPTSKPTTAMPTSPPTTPFPTNVPTPAPTGKPTTAAPTIACDCTQITQGGSCKSGCGGSCIWEKGVCFFA